MKDAVLTDHCVFYVLKACYGFVLNVFRKLYFGVALVSVVK